MIILVDMDDTIVNTTEIWVEWVNGAYGTSVLHSELADWDVSKAFPTLTAEQVYGVLYSEDFWASLRPIPGAREGLQALRDAGHRVYIVSNSHYVGLRTKMERVLLHYFPFIRWEDVILAADKSMIRGDVLIDDGPQNLLRGDFRKLLFTAPHNRSFDAEAHGMTRVDCWEDVLSAIAATEIR